MWYFAVIFLSLLSLFLPSRAKIRYVFDGSSRFEIHFVFFSLHFTGGKRSKGRKRLPSGSILRATRELIQSSSVIVDRLSVPQNSSPTLPDVKFFGISISYPLIYAYLNANSQRLIVSENAVEEICTERFRFLVDISLETTVLNLLRALFPLLFTAKRRREA